MGNHDHDDGLEHDLKVIAGLALPRRQVLRWAAGAAVLPLLGCGGGDGTTAAGGGVGGIGGGGRGGGRGGGSGGAASGGATQGSGGAGSGGTGAGVEVCDPIPEETVGPYPADGSNGPNVLDQLNIVRSDIRASVGGATGIAAGIPLTMNLKLVNSDRGCFPLSGYAIYVWHCDKDGLYSLYSPGVTTQNYLRGVQVADDEGRLSFTTIFPGCYPGRWPHVHFEIFPSLAAAATATEKVLTSQFALPETACAEAYATAGYAQSVSNLSQISLTRDGVFSDGWTRQMATATSSLLGGFVSTLTVAIAR